MDLFVLKKAFCFFLFLNSLLAQSIDCEPFGIRLSLGDYFQKFTYTNDYQLLDSNALNVLLRIAYLTNSSCSDAYVTINSKSLSSTTSQIRGDTYVANSNFSVYQHVVELSTGSGLSVETDYYYTVHGNTSSTSVDKTFRLRIPNRDKNEQTLLIFGGMDIYSEYSNITFSKLQNLSNQASNVMSAVIYTGNMAYNLFVNDFANTVLFLKRLQGFAAFWPFMPTPGAIEATGNFGFYDDLFWNINDNLFNGFFYSFNLGKAHFIQINTQMYFNSTSLSQDRENLLSWLEADLKNANISSNRKERPWIIVYGYRSFYCSYTSDLFCGTHTSSDGFDTAGLYLQMETLFKNYLVDLYISSASKSIYERQPPIFNKQQGSYSSYISPDIQTLYMVNPQYTVYLVEGVGGNYWTSENKYDQKLGFTINQGKYPGYGKMTIYNGTHIKYEHVSSESTDSDTFYLINTNPKWPIVWEDSDKRTFIIAFVFFVVIGSIILTIFMLYLE